MPDPIKDLYNSVKAGGLFVDENDFRSQLAKSPKEVYSVTSDLFVDYNDFEKQVFKKKDGSTVSQVSPSPSPFDGRLNDLKRQLNEGLLKPQRTPAPAQLQKAQQKAEFEIQKEASTPKVTQMSVFSKPTFKVEYPKDQEITAKVLGFQNRMQMEQFKEEDKQAEQTKLQNATDDFYNTTTGKLYFNVFQPMVNSASRTIGNVGATVSRAIGEDQLADQLVESFTPEKRYEGTIAGSKPTKLQGSLFNNGKMDMAKLPSKIVGGLTDMAWLLAPAASLTKVGTAAGLSQKAAQGSALFGSSYLNSREGYYQDGKAAGLRGDQLDYYASGAAVLTSSLEALFPNDIALGGFKSKLAKEYAKQIANGVTAKTALKAGLKDVLMEAGVKEPTQEILQLAGDKVAKTLTDMTSGKDNFGEQFDWDKSKDEIYETVVLTPIISAISSGSGALRSYTPSNYEKSLFFDASNNSDKVFKSLDKQASDGLITPEQYNNAKEKFTKYNLAADQVKRLGYSDDQSMQMAWELFSGKEKLPTTQAVAADPILKDALGQDIKKDKETTSENIRLIGMGIPAVGSEIDGKEVSFVISNIGNKGTEIDQNLVDQIGDDTYRVEDVNVKDLYNNDPAFKSYVDQYKKGSISSDALMVPAVIKEGAVIDGRARLAEKYLSGKEGAKAFKNISSAPEVSKIESLIPEQIEVTGDATDFANQMQSAQSSLGRAGMSVSPYAQEDYDQIASEGGKFLRAADNKILALLKPNGEMVSLVKDATVKTKGAAQAMISKMKDMGGLFMDNYDIYLTPIYEKAGYKVAARVPFNEEYAPEGWNAEDSPLKNKPDVVFMVRNDIAPAQDQTFTDYEDAQNYTQGLVDNAVAQGIAKLPNNAIAEELMAELGDPINAALDKAIPNAAKSLEKAGIKFQVVDGATETEAAQAARGNQALFLSDDGTIIIDRSKLQNDIEAGLVVWHEASHPVMNIIRNTNKPLYDSVVRGINEAAKNNSGVAEAVNWAQSQEQYDNADIKNDEAIVETIGRINSGLIDVSKLDTGLRQKLIDFVNSIAKFFGIDPILNDTDIAAFKKTVSDVADALKTGRDIAEVVGSGNVKEYMNNLSSPEIVAFGQLVPQPRVGDEKINVYESKEVSKLPQRSMQDIYDQFGGKAVVINSDPTRVGELTLPSGKKIFMYGGPAYLSVKENVDGNVGFATTQLSKVKTWSDYVKELFGNDNGVTLVATQAPTAILSNSYALRYVMDAVSMLPKGVLKSSDFKSEFFGKDLVLLKDAFGEKGYNEFVTKYKKADLSKPEVIDGMIAEMAYKVGDDNKPASFKARGAFVANLLGGLEKRSKLKTVEGDTGYVSKKPSKYISGQLFDRLGVNAEKVIREIGEPSLVDLYMNQGVWGIAVSGFETDPNLTYDSVQDGGVKHPLFNAKFPGKNPFILDGAYEVNKMFEPIEMTGPKGGAYTKTAAQMLAGSMYVKGQQSQTESAFKYVTTQSSGNRIQASVGNRPEQSREFKIAAFVMRKIGEGANKKEIAQGVASATGMSAADVAKIMENPEQFIRDSFPELSKIAQDNLIERANIQNIYRGHNAKVNPAFTGMEVPRSKVVEYLNKTNKTDKAFAESVKDFKNKWLDPARGLPDWVMAIKDFASGSKNIEIARAVKSIERLKAEAKKIGFTDWDAFSKAMVAVRDIKMYIPDEDGVTMFDPYRASAGKMFTTPDDMLPAVIPDELKALPESIRPFAVQMRQQVDGITKDLIGSGYVTPEQAVTLEKNLGQYVNRSYKMFNERGYKPKPDEKVNAIKFIADQKIKQILSELFPAGKKSNSKAVSDFNGNVMDPDNVNMEELYNQAVEEAKKDVEAILDKKRNPYFNTSSDSRDTGILKEKKDIPEPLRKLMGEYTDPGTVFVMTVAKQAALKAQSEYLTKLREFGMGTMFYEKNDPKRPAEYSIEIASTGTESKSPLGGLYTTPEIAEAMEMADPTYNELTQVWMKMVGAVRWGKTVGSVATQFKNFESNLGFAVMNGLLYTGKNTQAFKGAGKYVKGQYSKAEIDAVTEKLIKLNLVGQSVGARELSEMLGSGDIHDIALDIAANSDNKWGKKTKTVIKPFSAANKLYRMGDDFWKAYAYLNEREMVANGRFKSNYESLTKEQQDKVDIESSERVKNTWPTYDRVVEGAKYVSKRAPILGNFISFQAESIRVLANTIKMAKQDMQDPEMKAAGIKRALGISSYLVARAGLTYAAASAAGMAMSGILGAALGDDDEEQKKRAFKKALPVYARTADIAVVPTNDPHRYTVFSLSSLDPYGIIPNSLNALTEGREGIFSKEMQPGVKAAAAEFFSGFLEPEMTFSTMYAVTNNINPKTGRPIVLDSDTDSQVFEKVASFMFDQLKPSTISLIERGMERGWSPELASIAGARPIDVDFHKSFGYVLSDMSKQMDAIKSEYSSVKYKPESTEKEKADAEMEAERKKAYLISKVSQVYRDFIKSGANPAILNEMITERSSIKTTGFDKTTKNAIKTGEVKSEKLFK